MEDLCGRLVKLRPVDEKDFQYMAQLKNDFRSQGWSQRLAPKYTATIVAEAHKKRMEEKNAAVFCVETLDGTLLGTVNYSEHPRLSASIGISFGIEHWSKGYAEDAQEVLLRYLFLERGVACVRLWTQSGNPRAVRAAQKLGFKISARVREGIVINEQVADNLMMDLLREEWFASRGLEDKVKTGHWLAK